MADAGTLDRVYDFIMRRLIADGQAQHSKSALRERDRLEGYAPP